jgi:hypothetical protein
MFWRCHCCHSTPAFFAESPLVNAKYPNGVGSLGLYGTDCKLISVIQDPLPQWQWLQQQTRITPADWQAGSTFTINISAPFLEAMTVTYTATATDVPTTILGLINAIKNHQSPVTQKLLTSVYNVSITGDTSIASPSSTHFWRTRHSL